MIFLHSFIPNGGGLNSGVLFIKVNPFLYNAFERKTFDTCVLSKLVCILCELLCITDSIL